MAEDRGKLEHAESIARRIADLPEAERDLAVEQATATDYQLRDMVGLLLEAERSAFLSEVAAEDAPTREAGETHGPFKLTRRLGRGGFGEVFEAEQLEPVKRRVAVKFLRPDRTTLSAKARFDVERRAHASMEHPGIVRLLDVGEDDSGSLYLVMEMVDGPPITTYADKHELALRQRLRLFISVCRAVHHAHVKGFIHRDLKPANILVAEVDGEPTPRVIDFGIVHSVEPAQDDTGAKEIIGTPEYMSPEQLRGEVDVDTRSDVYALGVLLRELLTGERPQRRDAAGETSPLARVSDIEGPAGRIPRSAEWVIQKALRRDRDERYDSASALAADVERALTHEPLDAGPKTLAYRVGLLARRFRVTAAVAAALLLVLVLGFAGTSVGFQRATAEAAAARVAEADARVQAARAEQVTRFLRDLIKGAQPSIALGADVSLVTALVDNARDSLNEDVSSLRDDALIADVRTTLGEVYGALGAYDAAAHELELALDAWQRTGKQTLPRAEVLLAAAIAARGDHDAAIAAFQQSIDRLRREPSPDISLGNALREYGTALYLAQRLDEARETLAEARSLTSKEDDPRSYGTILNDTALVMLDLGDTAAARTLLEDAIELRVETFGPNHPDVAVTKTNLAVLAYSEHDDETALRLERESLAIQRNVLPPTHPALAIALNNIAVTSRRAGDLDFAAACYAEAVEILEATFQRGHPDLEAVRSNLGRLEIQRGNFDRAYELCAAAHDAVMESLGPDDQNTVLIGVKRARAALALDKNEEALELTTAAVDRLAAQLPPENPSVLDTQIIRIDALLNLGRSAEAAAAFALVRDAIAGIESERYAVQRDRIEQRLSEAGTP